MKEQDYQKRISDNLTSEGWYVLNLIKTNKNGITDLQASRPGRVTMWIECKTPKGKLSSIQEFRLDELTGYGFNCFVSYGMELVEWEIKNKKTTDLF
jgi:hypothetical protein